MVYIIPVKLFEKKYYNMEYRIKSQKQGYGHSDSSESIIDWAVECVLDEQAFEKQGGDIQVIFILNFIS